MQKLRSRTILTTLPPLGKSGGYTLIELLVVIGLISIITLITFNSLDTGNDREQTRALADTLRTDLKAQEENSLSNRVDQAGNPAGYYGILFGASVPFTQYSLVRLEKYPTVKTFDCTQANCNTTVLSTYKAQGVAKVSVRNPANLRAIFFTQTTGAPVFYSTTSTVLNPATATVTITGIGSGLTVSVSSVGTITFGPKVPIDVALARTGLPK